MSSTELTDFDSLPLTKEHLKSTVVLTGAGISAESGIPTFRGKEGLWKKYRPEELATQEAFQANPGLVWEWYKHRRHLISTVQPNAGHFALADLENTLGSLFTLITQNVDNLHRWAGSKNPIELHGNIFTNRCNECHKPFSDDALDFTLLPPYCPECNGAIRPNVVWFGENLDSIQINEALMHSHQSTLFLAIGTSTTVQPAASLPSLAKNHGALLIEINPDSTPLSSIADYVVHQSSSEALPALVKMIQRVYQNN